MSATTANFWQGAKVRLRAIKPEDAPIFHAWNLDSEMARLVDFIHFPVSARFVRQWAEGEAAKSGDGDQFTFAIEDLDGNLAGIINTHGVDRRVGTFKYGLAIRDEFRRLGYASEAILILLRYYFEELRYQKVTVHVYAINEPSIHLHERLGFGQEGRLRRMIYTAGAFHDELIYGMTAEEFQSLHRTDGS